MEKKRPSRIPTPCTEQGWVLVYALVLGVMIQGMILITATLATHNLKSAIAFMNVISREHIPAGASDGPVCTTRTLDAPEGWDHHCFVTELTEETWAKRCRYTWRVGLREQPEGLLQAGSLSGWRPYVILLVDDSEGMLASCGRAYGEDALYLERPGGRIVPAEARDDVQSSLELPEGTCFAGSYGNTRYRAADIHGYGGAMQCWTLSIASLKDFINQMDLTPMAVAAVSGSVVQGFTTDRAKLFSALEELNPDSSDARISEALFDLLGEFPQECGTGRHIVVATAGVAVNDGHLPPWLTDYDNDGNPLDAAVESAGSHCLDDVAAYARDQGVTVHVIGPDTPFLRAVAQKGGGFFMPSAPDFDPPKGITLVPRSMYRGVKRFLTSNDLVLSPSWLDMENTAFFRRMATEPPGLLPADHLAVQGSAGSTFMSGATLLCTTSRDHLLSIDPASGACTLMIEGVGGKVSESAGLVIAGPDIRGEIQVIDQGPDIRWKCRGDLFAASESSLYTAYGADVRSHALDDGFFEAQYTLPGPVTALMFDPCEGLVLAGSHAGTVYVLGQDLSLKEILATGLPEDVTGIRCFSSRRRLHVVVLTERYAACTSSGKTLWSRSMEGGSCTGAVVMDFRLYLSLWEPGPGGGADTGDAVLAVIDALTGETLSRSPLFEARAFGPFIDPEAGILEHVFWDRSVHETDVSHLTGIAPQKLGTRIMAGPW